VCCQCTHQGGRLRTMCGLRISGWLLPSVMSDWQCCVDWFLAKYCRCRLRLDSCWCRWITSAKGHCRWGLQVWKR
jgi:AMMECR1 domain-containing protein